MFWIGRSPFPPRVTHIRDNIRGHSRGGNWDNRNWSDVARSVAAPVPWKWRDSNPRPNRHIPGALPLSYIPDRRPLDSGDRCPDTCPAFATASCPWERQDSNLERHRHALCQLSYVPRWPGCTGLTGRAAAADRSVPVWSQASGRGITLLHLPDPIVSPTGFEPATA